MELKIGVVAKMTGLSPSGIRFLEEQGIVSPDGGRNGKYRSYSMTNVAELLDYRNYRKCGLNQEEIEALFRNGTTALSGEIFNRHCDEIEREIKEKIRLLHFLRGRYRDLALIDRRDTFYEITQRPSMIRMPLTDEKGKPSDWPENIGFEIPYTDSILLFSTEGIVSGKEAILPKLGIGMLEGDISSVSFLEHPGIDYLRACRAFHCIVEIGEDFILQREELERLRGMMRQAETEHGVHFDRNGRAVTRRILSEKRNGRPVRYDHLWIEVV